MFAHHHSVIRYALLYLARHSLTGVAAVIIASDAGPWAVAFVESEHRHAYHFTEVSLSLP
jgi:hypothetical protein